MEVAKAILQILSGGSLGRTELEKRVFRSSDITMSRFRCMLTFLLDDGDIEKIPGDRFSPYRLTVKGKEFLAWRAMP
jgi:predicted transcriptional regulator